MGANDTSKRATAGRHRLFAVCSIVAAAAALAGCAATSVSNATPAAFSEVPASKPAVSLKPQVDPQSVSFVSAAMGYAWGPASSKPGAQGVLVRTRDGGQQWTVVKTPRATYTAGSGVQFTTRRDGYIFGQTLLITRDGGQHWSRHHTPRPIVSLAVRGGSLFALVRGCASTQSCASDRLYRVSQNGRAFTKVASIPALTPGAELVTKAGGVYLLGVPRPPASGSSSNDAIWVSNKPGRWSKDNTPCPSIGTPALAAWSAQGLAIACGTEPGAGNQAKTFYRSTDGGKHWRYTGKIAGSPGLGPMSPGYIADLSAASARTWGLAEARGVIEITHDGGRHWHSTLPPALRNAAGADGWDSVTFVTAKRAVAVPETISPPLLVLSSSAGDSWAKVTFPAFH